jgi:hypothetical protein
LRENWPQVSLLVRSNAFVGGMVGLERTVVPRIGAETFRIASSTIVVAAAIGALTFLSGVVAALLMRER